MGTPEFRHLLRALAQLPPSADEVACLHDWLAAALTTLGAKSSVQKGNTQPTRTAPIKKRALLRKGRVTAMARASPGRSRRPAQDATGKGDGGPGVWAGPPCHQSTRPDECPSGELLLVP